MNLDIYGNLLNDLESQIKKAETDITKEKESVLHKIECTMEGAVDKVELSSLNRQYEATEKQFEDELFNQRCKTIKGFVDELDKLTKHIQRVYSKELKNK